MTRFIFFLIQPLLLLSLEAVEKKVDVYWILPLVTKEELRDMNLAKSFIAETFKNNYFTGINFIYSEDEKTYFQLYIKGNQHAIGSDLLTIAKNYSNIKPISKYYFIHSLNKDLFEEYIVLSKNIPNIKTIKGQRGVTDGSKNAEIFSDMTCLSQHHKECLNILSIERGKTAQDAIFKLYFDQTDVAFVPLRGWEASLKLNPALGKSIKVIFKSPKVFTYAVLTMRTTIDEDLVTMAREVSRDMTTMPEGKQLSMITKIKSSKLLSPSEIDPIITYYLKYLELKKRL